jgi:hypothetical protein
MTRFLLRFGVLLALLFPVAAFAQQPVGAVASFNGTISSASQTDSVAFEVDATTYHTNSSGKIGFVFVMSSVDGSVDPGLIGVEAKGSGSVSENLRKPDTAGSSASIALAALSPESTPSPSAASTRRPAPIASTSSWPAMQTVTAR